MQNYVSKKELADKIDEERRQKEKKLREIETKRILDVQLQEREQQKKMSKYEEQ